MIKKTFYITFCVLFINPILKSQNCVNPDGVVSAFRTIQRIEDTYKVTITVLNASDVRSMDIREYFPYSRRTGFHLSDSMETRYFRRWSLGNRGWKRIKKPGKFNGRRMGIYLEADRAHIDIDTLRRGFLRRRWISENFIRFPDTVSFSYFITPDESSRMNIQNVYGTVSYSIFDDLALRNNNAIQNFRNNFSIQTVQKKFVDRTSEHIAIYESKDKFVLDTIMESYDKKTYINCIRTFEKEKKGISPLNKKTIWHITTQLQTDSIEFYAEKPIDYFYVYDPIPSKSSFKTTYSDDSTRTYRTTSRTVFNLGQLDENGYSEKRTYTVEPFTKKGKRMDFKIGYRQCKTGYMKRIKPVEYPICGTRKTKITLEPLPE